MNEYTTSKIPIDKRKLGHELVLHNSEVSSSVIIDGMLNK